MILPVLHPQKARHYGVRTGGGLLLYGPPGTGKTMLAKAVATEVDAAFYHVRPSDIMSGQVGQAEANIDRLFRTLRRETRAVLFIDEVEALVPSRRRNGSTIMQRVISQILGEVDGLAEAPDGHVLLLIGATNEPDMIDLAMMRPGRFDAKVLVALPNQPARRQILKACLRGRLVSPGVDLEVLAARTEGLSGADLRHLAESAADAPFWLRYNQIALRGRFKWMILLRRYLRYHTRFARFLLPDEVLVPGALLKNGLFPASCARGRGYNEIASIRPNAAATRHDQSMLRPWQVSRPSPRRVCRDSRSPISLERLSSRVYAAFVGAFGI